MFRGNAPAKIDDRGRLRVPTVFRQLLGDSDGSEVFVTSIQGTSTLVYPLPVWDELEARLSELPATHSVKRRFLERVAYFGHQTRLDSQARIVIPQILREKARMSGEVLVFGRLDHLEIWNRELFESKLNQDPFTVDDYESLSEGGI